MLTIAIRLVTLVTHLRQAVAAHLERQARPTPVVWLGAQAFVPAPSPDRLPRLPTEAWLLLWRRLGRLATRFEILFARWTAGHLPRRRPSRPRTTAHPATPSQPSTPRLPRVHGWVNHRIPDAAPPSGHLGALLRDPVTRAFVQAAPQAGRLLRPLCRALGVPQPEWLKLPVRTRKQRPTRHPAPESTPPPAGPDRPLPPYVRSAARAWKPRFG